jgi:hypothetical protein
MKSLIFALTFLISAPAWAYYDVLDNGEILPKGTYKLTGGGQFLTDHGGLNVESIIDAGFQDEFGIRGMFGFGKTDIFAGGMFKWMPIPDIEKQPAIGFNAGLVYGKWKGNRDLTFRIEPIASKKFNLDTTVWTPYVSLPFGWRTRDSEANGNRSDVSWQAVAGTQLQVPKWKKLQFIAEVGMDLSKALSHVSFAAILYFDDENGIKIE